MTPSPLVRARIEALGLVPHPLELWIVEGGVLVRTRLGPLDEGCVPSAVVRAGAWQAARAGGGHALVTCTVGPGFDFADFRLLGEDPAARRTIEALGAEAATLL